MPSNSGSCNLLSGMAGNFGICLMPPDNDILINPEGVAPNPFRRVDFSNSTSASHKARTPKDIRNSVSDLVGHSHEGHYLVEIALLTKTEDT
jgi:hypothetical protein